MASLGDLPLAHTLDGLLKGVLNIGQPCEIPAWTIRNAQPIPSNDYSYILINPDGFVLAQAPGEAISDVDSILTLCCYIDTLAKAPTTYANIPQTVVWPQFYPKKEHSILYVDGLHAEESMPCVYCGIVLPPRLMQIDHQRPQVGGETEATVKTLRMLGFTIAKPHGEKCVQLKTRVDYALNVWRQSRSLNHSMPVLVKGPNDGDLVGYARTPRLQPVTPRNMRTVGVSATGAQESLMRQQWYTLNADGEIIYSVIKYFQLEERLCRQAMHSVTNLRPLCGPCNNKRGNGDLKAYKI